MDSTSRLRLFARISLFLFFIVILAGSIVRTTGSGMGCPDWPKCFGYYVPPTSIDPLLYQPGHPYEKGQMVVHNDTLWVANKAFQADVEFVREDWHKYPRHDYAAFNAVQTWIEYINRLATAVFALPVLLMLFFAFKRWRHSRDVYTLLFAAGAVIMIGFEAWLGKLVVDGNLRYSSVTLHMLGSLAIVLCILAVLHRIRSEVSGNGFSGKIKFVLIAGVILSVVQIMLGTQVREQTDHIATLTNDRSVWIDQMNWVFYVHRSFSILVVAWVWWTWKLLKDTSLRMWANRLGLLIASEIVAGVILAYFSMPAVLQPVHLLFAVMWFALSVYMILTALSPARVERTSNH